LLVPATAGLPLAPALTAPCAVKYDRMSGKGKLCRVEGCATPLPLPESVRWGGAKANAYCFRYRVCAAHLRAPSVQIRGMRSAAPAFCTRESSHSLLA